MNRGTILFLEGIFALPLHLSSSPRELLKEMLVVDPMKRISISNIRKNPWFSLNLPAYLLPPPDVDQNPLESPDDSIINELSEKLGHAPALIRESLKRHRDTQDQEDYHVRQICVAYCLVLDHRRMVDEGLFSSKCECNVIFLSQTVGIG